MVKAAERLTDTVRQLLVPALFEELGFHYGPIDGHNISLLRRVAREAITPATGVIHVSAKGETLQRRAIRGVSTPRPARSELPPIKRCNLRTATYSPIP